MITVSFFFILHVDSRHHTTIVDKNRVIMIILNDKQIKQKIRRLAFEIIEQNIDSKEIQFVGINNNGVEFAKLIINEIKEIKTVDLICNLHQIRLNPAKPLSEEIRINTNLSELKNKTVILVDDVGNTGRTLFFACRVFMDILVKSLKVAVLIDRKHKSYPIQVHYLGLSLATTINDNILVDIKNVSEFQVILN